MSLSVTLSSTLLSLVSLFFKITSTVDLLLNHNTTVAIDKLFYHVSEFIPYVFQILSLLIELHRESVPDTYMQLFPHLLTPLLWERPGNIPPLVRLLQAYIEKGARQIEPEKLVSWYVWSKNTQEKLTVFR